MLSIQWCKRILKEIINVKRASHMVVTLTYLIYMNCGLLMHFSLHNARLMQDCIVI